jgi:hypothetical protein
MKYILVTVSMLLVGCAKYHSGKDAPPCTTYTTSVGAIIQCPDGTQTLIPNGAQGAAGTSGSDGARGADGASGSNGTVIVAVDLCPGITSTQYRETLLRIDGKLYGVYYDAGAQRTFLSEIGPGSWVTTDGRSCYFTVNADLSITQ